jgi:hypothetical protein
MGVPTPESKIFSLNLGRKIQPNIIEIYELIRNNAIGDTCDSRKDAKAPRFGEISRCLTLRAWRLGAINFLKVVLLNILEVKISWLMNIQDSRKGSADSREE